MAARVARAIAIQRHEGERGHASFVDSRLDAGIQEQRRIGGRYGEQAGSQYVRTGGHGHHGGRAGSDFERPLHVDLAVRAIKRRRGHAIECHLRAGHPVAEEREQLAGATGPTGYRLALSVTQASGEGADNPPPLNRFRRRSGWTPWSRTGPRERAARPPAWYCPPARCGHPAQR